MTMMPISHALISQLEAVAARFPPPAIAALHLPGDAGPGAVGKRDAAFCAIELTDGAFGLSYLMLGDALARLRGDSHETSLLQGQCPLALARRFASNDALERALALACANALTESVWRQIGFVPPAAGNSLGDISLSSQDHLGMIGFFPPLVRQVQLLDCRLSVVELDEPMVLRQRLRFPGVEISLDRSRLAQCNVVVGTSTMLLNDTLDAMLAAAPNAKNFAVIGPSAGLWPDVLFERGVTLMGGTRIIDGAGFRAAMADGASWSTCAHKFAISAADWPGWRVLLA